MTSRWRISSSSRALLVAALLSISVVGATLTGSVELIDSREPAVRKSGNRSGVVIWLQRLDETVPASVRSRTQATIIQKEKRFRPHVLPVQVGTEVSFPNHDPIFHNAFSTFDGQIFDVGLYAPGTTRSVHFRREGVVRVFCNIHSTMSAVIVVVPSPWYTTTNEKGTWKIEGVPPGDYRLIVFHERATAETLEKLSQRIKIADTNEPQVAPKIVISESGYLPVPHKNKYGRDYEPENDRSYLGVRQ